MDFYFRSRGSRPIHPWMRYNASTRSCGFAFLISIFMLSGCAGKHIGVPQPARLSLPETSTVSVLGLDASDRERILSGRLKEQLAESGYYRLLSEQSAQESLHPGQTKAEIVISSQVIGWEINSEPVERRIVSDTGRVAQYCTNATGTVRANVKVRRSIDALQVYEESVSGSKGRRVCADSTAELEGELKSLEKIPAPPADVVKKNAGEQSQGIITRWLQSDSLFGAAIKKAVVLLVDHLDPKPVRPVYIFVFDGTGRKSGRNLAKARGYLRNENWDGAISVLRENLRTYPNSYASMYLIGVAEQGRKNFEAATENYKRAWKLCSARLDSLDPDKAADCSRMKEMYDVSGSWKAEPIVK